MDAEKRRRTVAVRLIISGLLAPLLFGGDCAHRRRIAPSAPATGEWRSLFDGKSLAGWKESDFFGAGKVSIENGVIILGAGALTGITWAGSRSPVPYLQL